MRFKNFFRPNEFENVIYEIEFFIASEHIPYSIFSSAYDLAVDLFISGFPLSVGDLIVPNKEDEDELQKFILRSTLCKPIEGNIKIATRQLFCPSIDTLSDELKKRLSINTKDRLITIGLHLGSDM